VPHPRTPPSAPDLAPDLASDPAPDPVSASWTILADTGGTFTDCVALGPTGRITRTKVLSTSALRGDAEVVEARGDRRSLRPDPEHGLPGAVVRGLACHLIPGGSFVGLAAGYDDATGSLMVAHGEDSAALPAPGTRVRFELRSPEAAPVLGARILTGTPLGAPFPPLALRLATTRGTNALLERKGARSALFVTRGFGDFLRIGDQSRPDLFALELRKPPPLAERVFEVGERTGAEGRVVLPLDEAEETRIAARAREIRDAGITSAAVVFLHAWRNPDHEEAAARILREHGIPHVVASSETAPFQGLLRRGETAAVEAYLGPVVRGFVGEVTGALPAARIHVMTSAGGLVTGETVRAAETLLSGPAGGVVGAAGVGARSGLARVLSFDMGGTSTDVARVDGSPTRVEAHRVGDATLQAPAVGVETVAAGGGSICAAGPNGLSVGPESAGADPGPACYGAGGPLTLTDANLLLGRLDPDRFGIPIDPEAARTRAEEVLEAATGATAEAAAGATAERPPLEVLLEGFVELADARMADAIRRISVARGYDPVDHALVAFGGAGPQHACAVAALLGIRTVLVPEDAGLLSAVGLGHAVVERFAQRQLLEDLDAAASRLPSLVADLEAEARSAVEEEGVPPGEVEIRERLLHLRYRGQESTLPVHFPVEPPVGAGGILARFQAAYEAVYGHRVEGRGVEVAALRVVAAARAPTPQRAPEPRPTEARASGRRRARIDGAWQEVPVFDRVNLSPGARLRGPALVFDAHSGCVVPGDWDGRVDGSGTLVLERRKDASESGTRPRAAAVEEELHVQRFRALVEEMGEQLRRTALSVNIRERLDYSCALLDADGRLVANAPHIPVHLGALGACVRSVAQTLDLGPGDVAVTNHPAFGGSHLPDVTVVTPVFSDGGERLGYVASRAHHAEIGGTRPGSMPPDARTLAEEGVVIGPRLLVQGGAADWAGMRALLDGSDGAPWPSRAVEENLVDLSAQVAANHRGAELLRAFARDAGAPRVQASMDALRLRAARRMEAVLRKLPDGERRAVERLDDGTPLQVSIRVAGGRATVDFEGSGATHPGNLNATEAIARSAVLYVLRLLAGEELPLNEGLLEPVELRIPRGILSPEFPDDPALCPAVVGGNTETSQRLVDALLHALGIVAGSQGTMNNVLFGDARSSYYETVAGGAGAGPGFDGASGVQVHMTNTRITDVEVLEHRFPVRVERFAVRAGSGGEGRWRGGEGLVRELTFLRPLELSVLGQHRVERPYGLEGGAPGAVGRHRVIRAAGEEVALAPIDGVQVEAGDRLILETPGGGGYGHAETEAGE
jgi:5-oxoprolinase (ATP-hydrolysing)